MRWISRLPSLPIPRVNDDTPPTCRPPGGPLPRRTPALLLTAVGLASNTGCIISGDFLPAYLVATSEQYELVSGGQAQSHSERLYCLAQDANDITDCDENGEHCTRGCSYTIQSVEMSGSTLRALEHIDQEVWLDHGASEWAHVDLVPTQASISDDREVVVLLRYPNSSFDTLREQTIATVTVLAP